jgi:hypothetical protein
MDKRQIGPFILEEQIGVGGMGVVYRATYPKNNKQVAVKVLSPGLMGDEKLLSRFEREIKILTRLDHPNIVKYYGGGTENNQRYYAMQFINGGSLYDVIKRRGRLSWEQVIHVGRQVCSALEHAHNAGIIHRDLKPANLFLSTKGRLMLGDFGIARDTEATALTAAGKTVGTYAYMAPEQIDGAHPISGRTDLYALGCLLYEALVGEAPFVSDNPAEMLMQHINDDPHNVTEFAPDCPVWLDKLIDRLLEKDPADRPFDALAVHTELGEIRDKLAEGNSVANTATLPAGQIGTRADRDQLRKSIGKKKKKKREDVPLHERTWFLAACLVSLAGLTTCLMMPPSVATLHERAMDVMNSGDSTAQREALDDYILKILERDPDGPYAAEAQIWADTIRLEVLERQMGKKAKGFGKTESRLEIAYVSALKAEQDVDANPLAAIERYDQTVQGLEQYTPERFQEEGPPDGLSPDEFRIWKVLFGRRLEEARKSVLEDNRLREHFFARMEQAEQLAADDETDQAHVIWDVAARLYQNVDRISDFQRYALQRRAGKDAPLPPIEVEVEPVENDEGSAESEAELQPADR